VLETATLPTFASDTARHRGLVGGYPAPSTAVLGAVTHGTTFAGLYHCGDTTFLGQSTVGASLSGAGPREGNDEHGRVGRDTAVPLPTRRRASGQPRRIR
jgi:phytoene dehydrogenase-like protein